MGSLLISQLLPYVCMLSLLTWILSSASDGIDLLFFILLFRVALLLRLGVPFPSVGKQGPLFLPCTHFAIASNCTRASRSTLHVRSGTGSLTRCCSQVPTPRPMHLA